MSRMADVIATGPARKLALMKLFKRSRKAGQEMDYSTGLAYGRKKKRRKA